MTYIRQTDRQGATLEAMLAGIAAAARRSDLTEAKRAAAIADAIAQHVADPALLAGRECPCSPDRYLRHLLHEDREAGYAVVALVWRPGQMSPVHAHKTWCAFGVHRGTLTETFYGADYGADAVAAEGEGEAMPVPSATLLRAAGSTCHGPADPTLIHRLANLSCGTAVSIHCYGAAYERMGDDVNHILAA